jgi:predicted outer membrane repeat protein
MTFKVVNALFLVLIFQSLNARIIFVAHDATGSNDGSSWENAHIKLDHALNVANYGDTIWVKEGHYLNYDGPFILKNGVKLFGGFKGKEYELSERETDFNHTKLTALRHGVLCINSDSTTLIDGFNFYINSAYPVFGLDIPCDLSEGDTRCFGGGLFMGSWDPDSTACLQIINCIFESNKAQNRGGALVLYSPNSKSGLWVSNTVFRKNTCFDNDGGGSGGAIYLTAGAGDHYGFYFEDCLFEENEAIWYGSVYTAQGDWDVEFKKCTFQNNKARRRGAALAKGSVSNARMMLIENCQFINNHTEPSRFWPGAGGAIYGEKLQIENCVFAGNIANDGGAIQGTDLVISNTAFLDNYAGWDGGAIYHLTYGNAENMKRHVYKNCTFSGNRADTTGGVVSASSVSLDTFINCIFYNNKAGLSGNNIHYWNYIRSLHFSDYNYFDTEDTLSAIWNIFENQDSMQIGPNTIFGGINPGLGIGYDGLLRPGDCSPLIGLGDPGIRFSHDLAGVARPTHRPSTIGALEPQDWIYEWKYRDETCYGYQDGAIWMEHSHALGPVRFSIEDLYEGFDTLFLHQGNYTVMAMDQAGCTADTAVVIYGMAEIVVQDSVMHASGQDMADGAIEIINISGDYPPFEVRWAEGETGQSVMGLVPGVYQATITDDIGCEKVISYVIDFTNSTQIVRETGIAIYPNPARDVLWIDIRNAHKPIESIRILNMMGGLVHEEMPGHTPDLLFHLNLRSVQSGVYIIQIKWEGGQTVSKVVVE